MTFVCPIIVAAIFFAFFLRNILKVCLRRKLQRLNSNFNINSTTTHSTESPSLIPSMPAATCINTHLTFGRILKIRTKFYKACLCLKL